MVALGCRDLLQPLGIPDAEPAKEGDVLSQARQPVQQQFFKELQTRMEETESTIATLRTETHAARQDVEGYTEIVDGVLSYVITCGCIGAGAHMWHAASKSLFETDWLRWRARSTPPRRLWTCSSTGLYQPHARYADVTVAVFTGAHVCI